MTTDRCPRDARDQAPARVLRGLALLASVALIASPIGGCQPTLAWLLEVPEVEPGSVARPLPGEPPLVIDLRDAAAYRRGHLPGALHVPEAALPAALHRLRDRPEGRRPLVFVCTSGLRSLYAASLARELGFARVASLRGGMEAWRRLGLPLAHGAPTPSATTPTLRTPIRRSLQVVSTAAGLVVKPIHMLLAFVLLLWIWRERAPDLVRIRLGLLLLLVGEGVCALNFLAAAGGSVALDLVHGLGMVAMGAFVPWGLYRMLDDRALHLTTEGESCALQRFCRRCSRRGEGTCPLVHIARLAAVALAILSLAVLATPLRPLHVVSQVFAAEVVFSYDLTLQLVDFRLYTLIALGFALAALGMLLGHDRPLRRAELPIFLSFGFLSYALVRASMLGLYRSVPAWRDFWEEATELLAVASVAVVLWVLRRQWRSAGPAAKPAPSEG